MVFCGKTAFRYELRRTKRQSLEIAVHPDKRVVVTAPVASAAEAIEAKVRKRARWIGRQIAYFDRFHPRTPEREYVGGESHRYLGRHYRLKIEQSVWEGVRLKHGYFFIYCRRRDPVHIKNLLDEWYRRQAANHITALFADCWRGFAGRGVAKPALRLQAMKSRWGSMSVRGRLTLNVRLIQAPKECIEYVIMHELCHLIHNNHSTDFYRLLCRKMPDWERRKNKLELFLA